MYVIGLIDDEEKQLKAIRRTIKENVSADESYDFKPYLLPDSIEGLVDVVFSQIMEDISEERITSLIIDYKIMVKTIKIKGTDIFKKIKEEVPKFPVIILTEVVEESKEPAFIDADKVYKKKDFLKMDSDYSKEKVHNIFDSMRKYALQKDSLELSIKELQDKLIEGEGQREELISRILVLESQLDEFIPTEQTQIDKVFDKEKIKGIVEIIEKANQLLE